MKGLELTARNFILVAMTITAFGGIIAVYFTSPLPEGEIITVDEVAIRACSVWKDKGFPDAATVATDFDADRDSEIDTVTEIPIFGGIADCNKDNLETLGQNFYNTGMCASGIGANEQNIKTRICGF